MSVWMEHSMSIFTIFNWAKRFNHHFKSLLSALSVCPLSAAVLVWNVHTHSQTYNPSHHPSSATLCKSIVFLAFIPIFSLSPLLFHISPFLTHFVFLFFFVPSFHGLCPLFFHIFSSTINQQLSVSLVLSLFVCAILRLIHTHSHPSTHTPVQQWKSQGQVYIFNTSVGIGQKLSTLSKRNRRMLEW